MLIRPILLIITLLALVFAPSSANVQGVRSGIAISPSATDTNGNRTYNVVADSAELSAFLKELFKVTGDQFTVDQDVAGPVDLNLKAATIDQVIKEVAKLAKPPIRIVKQGGVYRVSRDFNAQAAANSLRDSTGEGILQSTRPPGSVFGPNGNPYQALAPANRPVTLDVARERPISLADALSRISVQTNVMVRLDRRIPRELTFSGTVSRAPLGLVLQYIAEASDLKIVWDNSQVLLLPTDRFQIRVNEILIGQYPAGNCVKCGSKLLSDWIYCPRCGQAVARTGIVPQKPGSSRSTPNRIRNLRNPE